MIFRSSDSDAMYGNDFIIFKHGWGDDSEYKMAKNEYNGQDDPHKFSEESKTKMKKRVLNKGAKLCKEEDF